MTIPILETERLILRGFELADAPALYRLVSDRAIAATTSHIPHPYPEDGAEKFIAGAQQNADAGSDYVYGIFCKPGAPFVGGIGLHLDRENQQAEMGYWIGVPYWGKGYASEAARRLVRFGFEDLKLNRIHARHFANNPASGRVMQKAGMTYEATLRQHVLKWGEFLDVVCYGILRSEYNAESS